MAADDDGAKGYLGAHTRAAPGAAEAAAQPIEADQRDDVADLLDLIEGSPDLLPIGGLAEAAEHHAAQRRGRGRPKGSANRRNTSLFDYLEALGHRDPAVTLSMWQTADTKALAIALGLGVSDKTLLAVAALQVKAAAELLPYKYAKKPQQLELPDGAGQRAVMVIGELNGSVNVLAANGFMSAGVPPARPEKANEINADPCEKAEFVARDPQAIDIIDESDGSD